MDAQIEQFQTRRMLFLGEQNGQNETELKVALLPALAAAREIEAAYLVRMSLGETPNPVVALCLHGKPRELRPVLESFSVIFQRLFQPTVHLDMLFFNTDEIEYVSAVAKPFYVREP